MYDDTEIADTIVGEAIEVVLHAQSYIVYKNCKLHTFGTINLTNVS